MYTEEKIKEIHKVWEAFHSGNMDRPENLRPVIYDSWVRSGEYGVDPVRPAYKECSRQMLEEKRKSHDKLIKVARPYMRKLEEVVRDSHFIAVLADETGVVLETAGMIDLLDRPEASRPGADRSEKAIGCNAIGTAIYCDQPIQVWGTENYNVAYQDWTCSAAPIHDIDGSLMGVIDLSGCWKKAHHHTVGMVIAAADAIERQLKLEKEYDTNQVILNLQQATLSAINEGIIIADMQGIVQQVNNYACSLLDLSSPDEAVNHSLQQVLKWTDQCIETLASVNHILEGEMEIHNKTSGYYVYCSAIPVMVGETRRGTVLVLRHEKQVRKLINRSLGSYASFHFEHIIGHSRKIKEAIKLAKKAAASSSSVLLLGESGTGKELFAQAIHNHSRRADKPFIAINCGAIPRNLIESELFGYERGAFTGADKNGHMGKFELADGGTLLLDEIGDMPFELQVTLLRVLQNHEVIRIGGYKGKKVDVRIIAATNRDLELKVRDQMFREDLYYRLNIFTIVIPPLRERKEDIKEISEYFIRKYNIVLRKNITGLAPEAISRLEGYNWPGNVRELENVIERAMNLAEGHLITPEDLLLQNAQTPVSSKSDTEAQSRSIDDLTRDQITIILEKNRGNIRAASAEAGISRSTLYRMIKKYRLDIDEYR